ncbi:MAG: hypothetical protein ACRD22_22005 [Terriglobia bacterium]
MKIFNSFEHFWSWVVDKLLPKAETVATDVEAVLGAAATQSLLTLAGESQWQPKLTSIVGSIISGLQVAAKDGKDFTAVVESYGLNILLDQQALSDLEAIYSAVKSALAGKAVTVPVAITVKS